MLKTTIKLFSFLCVFAMISVNAQNTCSTAIAITEGTYTVGTIDGDPSPDDCVQEFSNGSNGEWYKYTASDDIVVTLTTSLEINTGIDTRVHIYSNSCGDLICLTGDDDGGSGLLSIVTFDVENGGDYFIVFDNRWGSENFDFELIEGEPSGGEENNDVTFDNLNISTSGSPLGFVDMNHDFLDDIVSVSGTNVNINYQKAIGGFDNVNVATTNADNTPSWSMACGDLDGNGYMDLLYGGGNGATIMYGNKTETSNPSSSYATNYTELSPSIYIFSQRTNFVDIDNDGLLDAFVCHDVAPNVYFINDGNGGLETHQVGDGNSIDLGLPGSNYATIFFDYDNDHDIDMYISKCTSTPNLLFSNNGDGTYTDVTSVSGLNTPFIRTWGSAVGDFDNDGFMDILIGASSGVNGLMRNNGDGTFSEVTAGSGFDTFNTTSHEYIAEDFNNDGYIDILSSGRVMINNGDMTFSPSATIVGQGPIGDANNDGFLDVLSGGTLKMNQNTEGNWLKVNTIGTTSNFNGIGARIEITSALGTQVRDIKSGVGFKYMSSITAHFGIGEDTVVESITVYWPSGNVDFIINPTINDTVNITEGQAPLNVDENLLSNVSIYPNPTNNKLTINSNIDLENSVVAIFDLQGKKVYNSFYVNDTIDVNNLDAGIYVLRIIQNNKEINFKFVKK